MEKSKTFFFITTLLPSLFSLPHISCAQELEPQAVYEAHSSFSGFHTVSHNTLVKYVSPHPEESAPMDRSANRKTRKTFELPRNTQPAYGKTFALIYSTLMIGAFAALIVFFKKKRARKPSR